MDASSISISSTDSLGTVSRQVQVAMLKKAVDLQAQQIAQLLETVPEPAAIQPGQPGGVINTFA